MKASDTINILGLAVILGLSLLGCSDKSTETSDNPQSAAENSSAESAQTESTEENSPAESNPTKPEGEPTFLICPDGTPVYTSEISEIYAGSEFDGNLETLTLEQAEQRAEECEGEFNVECGGYAYGFIPQKALNRVDNPEMFKDLGDGTSFDFLGGEDEFSSDYTRIKVGDKFGTLTVKSAYTIFSDDRWIKELSEMPGAYISGGAITFDGEAELTGYVDVWEDSDYQGAGGTMVFYPDGDSSVKIPVISYIPSEDDRKIHRSELHPAGYFGDWWCSLGNMSEVECDVSGLHKGDSFVKVKITAENVSSGQGGVWLELKSLEVL